MKKLTVKKNEKCMACLQCVQACSEAFYKEFDVTELSNRISNYRSQIEALEEKKKSYQRKILCP